MDPTATCMWVSGKVKTFSGLKQRGISFFSPTKEVGTGVAALSCSTGSVQGSSDSCFVTLSAAPLSGWPPDMGRPLQFQPPRPYSRQQGGPAFSQEPQLTTLFTSNRP